MNNEALTKKVKKEKLKVPDIKKRVKSASATPSRKVETTPKKSSPLKKLPLKKTESIEPDKPKENIEFMPIHSFFFYFLKSFIKIRGY